MDQIKPGEKMKLRITLGSLVLMVLALAATTVRGQDGPAPVLIQNAVTFDDVSEKLIKGRDVLVRDGMIDSNEGR